MASGCHYSALFVSFWTFPLIIDFDWSFSVDRFPLYPFVSFWFISRLSGRGEEVNHIVIDKIQGQNHSDTNNSAGSGNETEQGQSDSKTPYVTLDPATEARLKIVTVPANGPINVSNVSNTSSSTSTTSTPQSTSGNISEHGGNDTNDTNDAGELVHHVGMDSVISKGTVEGWDPLIRLGSTDSTLLAGTPQRRSPPMVVKQLAPQDCQLADWKV